MAYTMEPMPAAEQGIPQRQEAPAKLPDRVIEPYRTRTSTPKPPQPSSTIGQPDTSEVTQAVESSPTEDTVKLSPQIAALARKEQKFRQAQAQLEKEKQAIETERVEIEQLRAMKQKLAAKDYSGLEGLIDYNEYSQYQVNKANGVDPIQEELKRVNAKLTDFEKRQQESAETQFEAAKEERRLATQSLLDQGSFPRIKKAQATETVVQHIIDSWEEECKRAETEPSYKPQVLKVDQACKEVEEALEEEAKRWAALLEEEKKVDAVEEKNPLPPVNKQSGIKTLTNHVTASEGGEPSRRSLYGLSDAERYAEARRRAEERLQRLPIR